jgi:oligopeptide transport system ATP-binding protein
MAIALITHDLGVVAGLCERVMVMYAGRAVEIAPAADLFRRPQHPYTKGLLHSMPRLDEAGTTELTTIPGQPPNLQSLPRGCVYADRCPYVFDRCRTERPQLVACGPGRAKACHLERLQ